MLVLSRKKGESIILLLPNGEDVEVIMLLYKGKETVVAK